jgi:hypothetical protein
MGLQDFFIRDKKATTKAGAVEAPASVVKADEEMDIVEALLSGKELVTTIQTKYGDFDFQYPSGGDTLRIAHRRAEYLGGHPDSSYDNMRRYKFEQWATLDLLIVKKPAKFEKIVSWADFPDQDLVEELFTRGTKFRIEIGDKIRAVKKQ